jgi:hypothetical protein
VVAVRAVARAEVRSGWAWLAAWSVAVALVGGAVVACLLGADRSRTSLDRLIDRTNAAEVAVFAEDPSAYEAVGSIPDVARLTRFDLLAVAPRAIGQDAFLPMLAVEDGRIPYELNGARVVRGALPDPGSTDEIALHESTAATLGVDVGDRVEMDRYSPEDVERIFAAGGEGDSTGGSFALEVGAIIRDPFDVVSRPTDIVLTPLTPGVVEVHGDGAGSFGSGAFVELVDGSDVESFTAEVRSRGLELDVERWIGAGSVADTGFGASLDVIGDGLVAVALVVGAAGAVALGQAIHRRMLGRRPLIAGLRAVGLTRRERGLVAMAPLVVVAAAGAVLTVPVALAASTLFPIGVARRAEPDAGMSWSPWIPAGALLVGVAVLGLAAIAAAAAARTDRRVRAGGPAAWAPGVVGRAIAQGGSSVAWSTRFAVVGGVAGVAAVLVFAQSLDTLLETPSHYGWSFDAAIEGSDFDATELRPGVDVAADPAVAEVAAVIFQIEMDVEGSPTFGYAIGDGVGGIGPVVARGSVPRTADEVALGRETMARAERSVGDTVVLESGGRRRRFRVVGQGIVPVSADGNTEVGDGVLMSLPAARRLGIDPETSCGEGSSCYRQLAVRFHDDADLVAARDRLVGDDATAGFEAPVPPPEVQRLDDVEAVPWVVAGLLSALAAAATGHAIVVTVVRRRRDLAVLRALGATPRDNRRGVVAHAAVLVAGAAVVGSVLGIAAGRSLWRAVGRSVGVVAVPDVPVALVALLPLAAVALAVVAALVPARLAAGVRPADALRVE